MLTQLEHLKYVRPSRDKTTRPNWIEICIKIYDIWNSDGSDQPTHPQSNQSLCLSQTMCMDPKGCKGPK